MYTMLCGDSVVLVSFDVQLHVVHQTLPFSSSTWNHATIIGKFLCLGQKYRIATCIIQILCLKNS